MASKRSKTADRQTRPAALNILSLTDDALRRVLLLVPQHDRIANVPLVCKRWSALVADPSTWPCIHFSAGLALHDGEMSANSLASLRWLQRHSGGVEELVLQPSRTQLQGEPDSQSNMVVTALLAVAPAARLRQLLVPLQRPCSLSVSSLVTATLMSGLTRLAVAELRPESPGSHALDALFAGLPALKSATLHFRQKKGVRLDETQPFPMALLRCTRLTSLDFTLYNVSGGSNVLDFAGLPDGMSALQRLESLRLYNCLSQQLNSNVSKLTQLSSLDVPMFREPEHPAMVQALPPALPASLCSLGVPFSSFSHVTALTRLRRLKLHAIQTGAVGQELRQLSMPQLTSLQLVSFDSVDLGLISGCTGLQDLSIKDVEFWMPHLAALRLPQLTSLSLKEAYVQESQWSASLLLSALVCATPRLAVLVASHMCNKLYFSVADAGKFASLPRLREVNVAESLPSGGQCIEAMQQIVELQHLFPHIRWVVHVADRSTICS